MNEPPPFGKTVGDFVEYLKEIPPDTELYIEGYVFNRWKWRGPKLLTMELTSWETLRLFDEEPDAQSDSET